MADKVLVTSANWSAQGVPEGMTFADGVFSGTPTAEVGDYPVSLGVITPWGSATRTVNVKVRDTFRLGIKIAKNVPDPYERVEYMYDAEGLTPAHMDFTKGQFDYGDWGQFGFVTDNKPLMLRSNGTVGYYLDPDDYTKKVDGTASDVANTSYDGNAMAQFPLLWIRRYEDEDYEYEIVSNIQFDENYHAYAHTRADGSIADYFYWSLFGGSGSETKIRSLSGQTLAQSLTAEKEITGAKANGSLWYTHSWSQREFIRTLLILMGKSTNTQAVFGNGNQPGSQALLETGTLKDKGQFYGSDENNQQVKVFHVEKFWGDQYDRTAGLIVNGGKIYVKMTPEGTGYRITDTNGYADTGVTVSGSSGFISAMSCSEYGMLPTDISGSNSTYYADYIFRTSNTSLYYLLSGGSSDDVGGRCGAFTCGLSSTPSSSYWARGCGLSCYQPV